MMPEVGRVLDAARRVLAVDESPAIAEMREAMEALDAKLAKAGHEPSWDDQERAWGEVVTGDQILSTKTNRWYEVTRMIKTTDGKVKINIKGSAKPLTREAMDKTMVRRGVTGEAVDILETLWSMQTRPDVAPVSNEVGPMLTDKVEDDDE